MPYTASVDRINPGCILFLVDQSESMVRELAGQQEQRKMDAAADAVNRVIDNLAQRCSRGMEIRDYFDIGILGYGYAQEVEYDGKEDVYQLDENEETHRLDKRDIQGQAMTFYREMIVSVFPDTEPDWPFLPVGKVVDVAHWQDRRVRESDGEGGVVELPRTTPVWLHPHSGLQTPMCQALEYAANSVSQWISRHPDSFPPMVINISDGEATDGDPEPVARSIMDLATSDGHALMFNCHLSETSAAPIQYPDSENSLHNGYARQMFRISSFMPPGALAHAARLDIPVSAESHCCVFNADIVSLVQFLDIGTRSTTDLL